MANEIIKVFDTEANAIANGTTGRIDPVTAISNTHGIIANVADEVTSSNTLAYYIYKRFYYRIEANEPVTEFHIDWDDGENNSPEKANIEIIKLKTPSFSTVTSHIYTEHKHFFPLIRVKSMDGYLSKWYTNDASTNLSELEPSTVSAGQNEFSILSKEKAGSDRINSFLPANLPPIGILKADKKRIYSGIDNDFIKSSFNYPLLYTYSSSTASTKPNIKFTLQDNKGAIREHTLDNSSTNKIFSGVISSDWATTTGQELSTKCIPSGNFTANDVQSVQRIQIREFAAGGTPPDWDPWWTSTNDVYIDLHYESSLTGDKNGNFHCRIFMDNTTSDKEDAPTGATVPSGYSAFTIGVGSDIRASGGEDDVALQLQAGLAANDQTDGMQFPFITGAVVGSQHPHIDLTMEDVGAVSTATYNTRGLAEIVASQQTPGTGTPTLTRSVGKILRVELDNATELADTDRIYINVFDAGISSTLLHKTAPSETSDKTIAILSNGNPIVELDNKNSVYLDATESFTRASNLSISTYKFDDDKLLLEGATQSTDADAVSDLLSGTFTSSGTKEMSFTFNRIGDSVDSDSRFYSTYRLPRVQVKDNMVDITSPVVTGDGIDTLTFSAIEHFDDTTYTAANIKMPSELESRGLLLYSNRDTEVSATWTDVSTSNIDDSVILFGGTDRPLQDSSAITDHPRNHIFIAKTDKFDRVFFRMENTNVVGESNWPPTVAITAYYGNGSTWYPLEIIDETQGLQVSGSIKFNMPHDWKKGHYTDVDGGDWNGPIEETDADNTHGPKELWKTANIGSAGAYGLIISIGVKGTSNNEHKIVCKNIWPYNNSHSQLIKMEDPHHISLNSIAIAQSISFGRSSKVISVEDKFGKSDIRKIGAAGGRVRFGGLDLGASDDQRKIMVGYQKNLTPVFLDLEHKSEEKTRFFGVISEITEDYPAGKMIPKWAVTMNISHVLELSSTGAINSDYIPIGGALVDDGKYLL